ncbi:MAG: FAD-dependent oxidoreductase [Nitriliruptoraceae bacterium]
MTTVAIVGDGPAGLSAALFLAKNDVDTHVFGQDDTAMHYAELHNYLGIDRIGGTEFQRQARSQVTDHGAVLHDAEVTTVEAEDDSFSLTTSEGTFQADYLILAGAKGSQGLAVGLGAAKDGSHLSVDPEYRTSVDRVYAVGRLVRPERSQAIISAGAGAIAALDILSREAGKDVTDWDTPDE